MFRSFSRLGRWFRHPQATIAYKYKFYYRPKYLAAFHGRALRHMMGRAEKLPGKGITAIVPYYGNARILKSFLAHHRAIGVELFVFLDLSDKRELATLLASEQDVAVWRTRPASVVRHGIHWLNYLRHRYCLNRWCLSIEPTEFFIFFRCEQRHLLDLTEILENEQRRHIYSIVIEAYGEGAAQGMTSTEDHPFTLLPYFDPVGYSTQEAGRFKSAVTVGGVQRRVLFANEPQRAPPLNRTSFVRWGPRCYYLSNTRLIVPHRFNSAHAPWHTTPTACLMRYSLLDDEKALATASDVEAASLVEDKRSPTYPGAHLLRHKHLKHAHSARFRTSQDLIDCGLLSPGQWF